MQMEAVLARDPGNGTDVIAGSDTGAAKRRDDHSRQLSRCAIGNDRCVQRACIHRQTRACRRHLDEVVLPDARHPAGLVDRGVHLVGGIDADGSLSREALRVAGKTQRLLATGEDRGERRRRCGILDNAVKALGQTDHLPQPLGDDGFEFGRGGRGLPEHPLRAHGRRQILGNERRRARIGRKVSEKAWMLPMRDAGYDYPLEVGEDRLHVLGRFGRRWRDLPGDVAGRGLRPDRALTHARKVSGAPVGGALAPVAKPCLVDHDVSACSGGTSRPE